MQAPDTFLAGFPKAGTTTLHALLATHPNIETTRVKEPAIYSAARNHADGERYLRAVMPKNRPERVLDATPWYAVIPSAVDRMSDVLTQPRTRVILLLRDPVERAYSMYWDQVRAGREERPVADALLDPTGDRPPSDQADARSAYVWGSRYELHVPRVAAPVSPDQLMVLATEHLAAAHLKSTWSRVQTFLGVPEVTAPDPIVKNSAADGPAPTAVLLGSPLTSVARRVGRWIPHELRLSLGEWLSSLGNASNSSYLPLEDSLRRELVSRLETAAQMHQTVLSDPH